MNKILVLILMVGMILPNAAFARGFSGHSSYSSGSSRTYSSSSYGSTSTKAYSSSYKSPSSNTYGKSYSTGYRSPSSNVTSSTNYNRNYTTSSPSRLRSVGTHAAAFGAGALFGSMFHPFGLGNHYYGNSYYGSYGGGSIAMSFFGFLIDLIVLGIIIMVIVKLFNRKKRF